MKNLSTNAKIIIGLIVLAIFIYVVSLVVLLGKKPKPPVTIQPVQIQQVLDEYVGFPTLSADKKSILFLDENSNLVSYDLAKKTKKKIVSIWPTVRNINWAPDKEKLIITRQDAKGKLSTVLYNITANKWKTYDSRMQNIVWSLDSKRIIYQWLDTKKKISTLNIANFDGRHWEKITDLKSFPSEGGYALAWVDDENIIFSLLPTEIGGSSVYLTNLFTKKTKKISPKDGLMGFLLSPDGKKAVSFLYKPEGELPYNLGVAEVGKWEWKDLMISFGDPSVERLSWFSDNKKLIAVISGEEEDEFYQIDVEKKEKTKIEIQKPEGMGDIFVTSLMLLNDKKVYFVSNEKLYVMEIQ